VPGEGPSTNEWDKITPLTSLTTYTNAAKKDEEYPDSSIG